MFDVIVIVIPYICIFFPWSLALLMALDGLGRHANLIEVVSGSAGIFEAYLESVGFFGEIFLSVVPARTLPKSCSEDCVAICAEK